jgi:hypothetical protein
LLAVVRAKLAVPTTTSVQELSDLGASLGIMTERLLREEDNLRSRIDEVERAAERLKEAQDLTSSQPTRFAIMVAQGCRHGQGRAPNRARQVHEMRRSAEGKRLSGANEPRFAHAGRESQQVGLIAGRNAERLLR